MGHLRFPNLLPPEKRALLEELGFAWLFDRDVFVNRKTRKIASLEFVEDHHIDDVREELTQESPEDGWVVSFNDSPSPGVVEAIIEEASRP